MLKRMARTTSRSMSSLVRQAIIEMHDREKENQWFKPC